MHFRLLLLYDTLTDLNIQSEIQKLFTILIVSITIHNLPIGTTQANIEL